MEKSIWSYPEFEEKGEIKKCSNRKKKNIYIYISYNGLKQSPKAWFDRFIKSVKKHGCC